MSTYNGITDIPGIRVGHAHDMTALTGCTVILCDKTTVGGVDKRGGSPSSRQTDQLDTIRSVNEINAVVLAGGSAFGLDAASGVVQFLEERGIGFTTPAGPVPIVPAAILYDLGIGQSNIRPNAEMGYQACLNASEGEVVEGNAGAGCGATVGKILGMPRAMKSGLGTASIDIGGGLLVGALVAVNAMGDVVDPESGKIVAGARTYPPQGEPEPDKVIFADALTVFRQIASQGISQLGWQRSENTVIGVVATNARLTKEGANKVAQMAHDGLARAVRPAHTMLDGDTIFALATGDVEGDVNIVGAFAAEVFSRAILRAVYTATSAGGIPALSDFQSP